MTKISSVQDPSTSTTLAIGCVAAILKSSSPGVIFGGSLPEKNYEARTCI